MNTTERKPSIEQLQKQNDQQAARIADLEAALAKSDPWEAVNRDDMIFYVCKHCGRQYNPVRLVKDQHNPGCVWHIAKGKTS